jgi:outer membrane protein assembly factor BamE (lipoprotein component of BamABCDE complex)
MHMRVTKNFKFRSIAAIVLLLAGTGCGSPVSQSNYNKVQTGMTQHQVEAILGQGKEQGSSSVAVPGMSAGGVSVPGMSMSAKVLTWQDGQKMITVSFENDKVVAKAQSGL